jgi:hypothetical protein
MMKKIFKQNHCFWITIRNYCDAKRIFFSFSTAVRVWKDFVVPPVDLFKKMLGNAEKGSKNNAKSAEWKNACEAAVPCVMAMAAFLANGKFPYGPHGNKYE